MKDQDRPTNEPRERAAIEAAAEARPTDRELADWLVNTCLLFGSSVHTAYLVAGQFLKGINQ